MNVIGLHWGGPDHSDSIISIANCSLLYLMLAHLGQPVNALSVPLLTTALRTAPFVGAPPPGAPVVKLAAASSVQTELNQVGKQSTQMRYASVFRTEPADLKSAHVDTAVSSVEAQTGPSPVQGLTDKSRQVC